jgi:hypothetical protein
MASVVSALITENAKASAAPVRKLVISWTSDGSGNATGNTGGINGVVLCVVFDPDDSAAPTDQYDVTLSDENGVDILAGQGANLSSSASSAVCPGIAFTDGTTASTVPRAVCGDLSLSVSNAGDTKKGQVVIYFR